MQYPPPRRPRLPKGYLEFGPLNGQILSVEEIDKLVFADGCYVLLSGSTHCPPDTEPSDVYRWHVNGMHPSYGIRRKDI